MMSFLILSTVLNAVLFFEKNGGKAVSLVVNLIILFAAVAVPLLNQQVFFPGGNPVRQTAIHVQNQLTSNLNCFLLGRSGKGYTVVSRHTVNTKGSTKIKYGAGSSEILFGCRELGLSGSKLFFLKKIMLDNYQDTEILINKADVDEPLAPLFTEGIKSTNLQKILKYAALFFFAVALLRVILNLVRIQAEFRLQGTEESAL